MGETDLTLSWSPHMKKSKYLLYKLTKQRARIRC